MHLLPLPLLRLWLHEGGETRERGPRPRHVVHDDLRAVEADHSARGVLQWVPQSNFCHLCEINLVRERRDCGWKTGGGKPRLLSNVI